MSGPNGHSSRFARAFCVSVFLFAIGAFPAAGESETNCAGHVCVTLQTNDYKVEIWAHNKSHTPAGLKLEFSRLVNVLADRRLPVETLLPPGKQTYVMKLVRQDAYQAASFPFKWFASYGDPKARHEDDFNYRMPFGGTTPHSVTQGYDGAFSHTGSHRYSIDIAMPIGTPILAARGGRVVYVADGFTEAGTTEAFLPAANAVTVMHEDGTYATYAHLDPGSGVRVGMWVQTGEMLGFSGNTGFSSGPHLHFSVWKGTYSGQITVPVAFFDASLDGFVPKEGAMLDPGCHGDGRPCAVGELPKESMPASARPALERSADGTCRCKNGAIITTHLPCRTVCS